MVPPARREQQRVALLRLVQQLELGRERLVHCRALARRLLASGELHGQHGALCDYYFFYERLRPFIDGLPDVRFEGEADAPTTLPGPSGAMSTLLPAMDAFLGVGGNAIQQALLDKTGMVLAIDLDPMKV